MGDRTVRLVTAAAAAALLLAGCSSAAPAPSLPPPSVPAAASDFLTRHGLDGLSAQQIVETLDASEEDREQGPVGSVRPSELLLADEQEEITIPIPDDLFYLAVAPYRQQTHDCYNHNLATCAGELTGEKVTVTVVDSAGATLIDQEVTTYPNGFAGIWLPRDITGTLTVGHDGDTASTPIATGAEDPTCLTTLQLG